jgi:hypothetical protein
MTVYSLLIGINEYQNKRISTLNGCENDVDLLSKTLQLKLNVDKQHINILKNQQATRQNIIDQFQQHLTQQVTADDVALFYFSGHGAQADTPEIFWDIEPDHLEESLVCYDSHVEDSPALRDKELRYLIKDLADTGAHIVILLDCCHGGHGTRYGVVDDHPDAMERVRLAPKDKTQHPLSSYLFNQRMQADLESTGGLAQGKHILIAACQDFQLSQERLLDNTSGIHGLFTYSLCKTLNTLQSQVSYRELRNRIHAFVAKRNLHQSPQVEAIAGANETETLFGGEFLANTFLVSKTKANNKTIWTLNAGALHGLHQDDQLALFNESSDSHQLSNVVTKARLHTLNSFDSVLEIEDKSALKNSHYSAIITQQAFDKMPIKIDCGEQQNRAINILLENDINTQTPAHYLKHQPENPDYILKIDQDNAFYITQIGDDQPLFEKQDNILDALNQLAVMARFWQKFNINNPTSKIPSDAVDIVIHYNGREIINDSVAFSYQYDGNNWQQPSFTMELRLKLNYPKPLYCALIFFDGSDGSITPSLLKGIYLSHQNNRWAGKLNAQPIVKAKEGKTIRLKIKDELLQRSSEAVQVQDYFKLIISEQEFDASMMEQHGLNLYQEKAMTRGLNTILDTLMWNAHYRSLGSDDDINDIVDWTSKSIDISISHPRKIPF